MFFVVALVTVAFLLYLLDQHYHSFWKRRGFVQLSPKFLVGDIGALMKTSFGEFFETCYKNYKEKRIFGLYMAYKPCVVVTDPVLIQNVMIRDFGKFHDRPVPFNLDNEPLAAHLFHLSGQKWRDLRVKLSPTFTSGKLKGMFSVMKDCGQVLDEYIEKNIRSGVDVFEFRELMARFNTNIISSVAFGIENDCINEPDHIFRRMGVKNLEVNWRSNLRNFMAAFVPFLFNLTNFKTIDPEVTDFIFSIVKQTVEYREKNNVERNDFMQLLIQLKNQGYVSADKDEQAEGETDVQKLSFNDMAAQVFVFFIAGYDTSSLTMSYCLHELAKNPDIQKKVQQEIDSVNKKFGDAGISYETLHEMKYLECCIDEALRKYPILPLLFRVCTEDYNVPDTEMTIPKGVGVFLSVLGLHRDPDIYENPLEFKPERFLNSATGAENVNGTYYLPFGDGPRNCIGMRMGKLTSKLGLAIVLSKYSIEFEDANMMNEELQFDPKQFLLIPVKKFDLKLTPRN